MAANSNEPAPPSVDAGGAEVARPRIPVHLRIAGLVLRGLFIGAILAVIWHVSSPQSETLWSAYETPGDLIRMALGVAVSLWITIHLFSMPKDVEEYRTWIYLGLIIVPFSLVVAFATW